MVNWQKGFSYKCVILGIIYTTVQASGAGGSANDIPENEETNEAGKEQDADPGSHGPHSKKEGIPDRRDRSHIEAALNLDQPTLAGMIGQKQKEASMLDQLTSVYHSIIQPVEEAYRFTDIHSHALADAEIKAKPLILLAGSWSVGKSTLINYLLGADDPQEQLRTGAEPTTSDFTAVMYGPRYKTVEGLVLATDPQQQFSALEKYGQGFLEKFEGVEAPHRLLAKITIIDTPGIIENRKQQERGYPYNDVMKWFIERADLILVMFDPSKLDVGSELESLFTQLKGQESKIRLILNKADSVTMQELMRVYGALFWNLAPLINVTEPPRVYIGSFWDMPLKPDTMHQLFIEEEKSLVHDIANTISNRVENKITFLRKHAYLVRLHALIVDRYVTVFNRKRSMFGDSEELLISIVENPNKYNIYHSVLAEPYVSKYDMFPSEAYKEFFSINALNKFKPVEHYCSMLSGCLMDKLVDAMVKTLPSFLNSFKQSQCDSVSCSNP